MRVHQLVLAAALALSAVRCSSEPAPPPADRIVESHPGALVITSPSRAAFLEANGSPNGSVVEVRGTGATPALTVNGEHAEVAPDGSFHANVKPEAGLNLIVAIDGESRLEAPFLYGHFLSVDTPIANAIALDIGSTGISGLAPAASLESVANLALSKRELLAPFIGQTFNGNVTGATWSFLVTAGRNGTARVALSPAAFGLGVTASVEDVIVDGRLSITAVGITYTRDVRITVGSATVSGNVELAVDERKGALTAAMPAADAKLVGFHFDTDNAGFPCCVDTILTGFIRPKVELAIRDGIREQLPDAMQLTLDGLGIPKQLDYAALGLAVKVPISTRFDGASFDVTGGTITAAVRFGGRFNPGTPGTKVPGWLALGRPYAPAPTRAPVLGVSFSIDAVNQLMFAAWGSGQLSFTSPAPLSAQLTPALPPVVSVTDSGGLRVALGEILVQRATSPKPIAAVTVVMDVAPTGEQDALVLTPKGEPTISITWLSDELVGSGRNLIAAAAKDELGKFLKPFRVPLPKFALDRLGAGLAGQSLAIVSPNVVVDPRTGRLSATGALMIVH